jgi:hypothetical protein
MMPAVAVKFDATGRTRMPPVLVQANDSARVWSVPPSG